MTEKNFYFDQANDWSFQKDKVEEVPWPGTLYDDNSPEDRRIIQPDGSRACTGWELKGKGFHLI